MNPIIILEIVENYNKKIIGLAEASLQLIIQGCAPQEIAKLLNIPVDKLIINTRGK